MKHTRRQATRRPCIGPCRDPLHLWYLEFVRAADGQVFRRYYANRDEARAALRQRRQQRRVTTEAPGTPPGNPMKFTA